MLKRKRSLASRWFRIIRLFQAWSKVVQILARKPSNNSKRPSEFNVTPAGAAQAKTKKNSKRSNSIRFWNKALKLSKKEPTPHSRTARPMKSSTITRILTVMMSRTIILLSKLMLCRRDLISSIVFLATRVMKTIIMKIHIQLTLFQTIHKTITITKTNSRTTKSMSHILTVRLQETS